jgi:hypothetical protein
MCSGAGAPERENMKRCTPVKTATTVHRDSTGEFGKTSVMGKWRNLLDAGASDDDPRQRCFLAILRPCADANSTNRVLVFECCSNGSRANALV